MLCCEECGCLSRTGRGWLGYIAADPDDEHEDDDEVAVYCPACWEREFR